MIFTADSRATGCRTFVRSGRARSATANLGYGHSGAKQQMDAAPPLDRDAPFDANACADRYHGSGTADLVYLDNSDGRSIAIAPHALCRRPAPRCRPHMTRCHRCRPATSSATATPVSWVVRASDKPMLRGIGGRRQAVSAHRDAQQSRRGDADYLRHLDAVSSRRPSAGLPLGDAPAVSRQRRRTASRRGTSSTAIASRRAMPIITAISTRRARVSRLRLRRAMGHRGGGTYDASEAANFVAAARSAGADAALVSYRPADGRWRHGARSMRAITLARRQRASIRPGAICIAHAVIIGCVAAALRHRTGVKPAGR